MLIQDISKGSLSVSFAHVIAGIIQPIISDVQAIIPHAKSIGEYVKIAFDMTKFLGGNKPSSITQNGSGNILVQNSSGNTFNVTQNFYHFFIEEGMPRDVANVSLPTRSARRSLRLIQGGREIFSAEPDEAKDMADPGLRLDESQILQTIEIAVRLKGPVLEGRGKWKFVWGKKVFTAEMEDEKFLDDVYKGNISFANGDQFLIRVRIVQTKTARGFKSAYFIEEIVEKR